MLAVVVWLMLSAASLGAAPTEDTSTPPPSLRQSLVTVLQLLNSGYSDIESGLTELKKSQTTLTEAVTSLRQELATSKAEQARLQTLSQDLSASLETYRTETTAALREASQRYRRLLLGTAVLGVVTAGSLALAIWAAVH